ncbi:MAG: diguanylate cyclase [Gemmatimonadota bacterium]
MPAPSAIIFGTEASRFVRTALEWARERGIPVVFSPDTDDLMSRALRARPLCVLFDARGAGAEECHYACSLLKADSYTGIVPVVVFCNETREGRERAFVAGADEVLGLGLDVEETRLRLDLMLSRSERDVNVHPSTRLPGTVEIERELERRIASGSQFAMCYADLDHFKEFNDRYSYYDGDRVIRLLSRVLHDVVKGTCGLEGFVGHIGGDDFIFVIPAEAVPDVCGEIVLVFDTLIPYQYSEQDRRAGYFFGKDRRGQLHRVPLMTLSIGVVTNERRVFTAAAQVSQLATEMKGYAKTLTGSLYSVDRRSDISPESGQPTPPRAPRAISMVDD